jgi:hypothetical protein
MICAVAIYHLSKGEENLDLSEAATQIGEFSWNSGLLPEFTVKKHQNVVGDI